MPNEFYSLLAVGEPIICVSGTNTDVVHIFCKSGIGVQSSVSDPKELADKILNLIEDPKKSIKMGQNGRKYFLAHFERKIITKQWNIILNKLVVA